MNSNEGPGAFSPPSRAAPSCIGGLLHPPPSYPRLGCRLVPLRRSAFALALLLLPLVGFVCFASFLSHTWPRWGREKLPWSATSHAELLASLLLSSRWFSGSPPTPGWASTRLDRCHTTAGALSKYCDGSYTLPGRRPGAAALPDEVLIDGLPRAHWQALRVRVTPDGPPSALPFRSPPRRAGPHPANVRLPLPPDHDAVAWHLHLLTIGRVLSLPTSGAISQRCDVKDMLGYEPILRGFQSRESLCRDVASGKARSATRERAGRKYVPQPAAGAAPYFWFTQPSSRELPPVSPTLGIHYLVVTTREGLANRVPRLAHLRHLAPEAVSVYVSREPTSAPAIPGGSLISRAILLPPLPPAFGGVDRYEAAPWKVR